MFFGLHVVDPCKWTVNLAPKKIAKVKQLKVIFVTKTVIWITGAAHMRQTEKNYTMLLKWIEELIY